MLHLTLVANIFNAVGGTPDLTGADFVPTFPRTCPTERTTSRSIGRFSREAVETFLRSSAPRPRRTSSRACSREATTRVATTGDAARPRDALLQHRRVLRGDPARARAPVRRRWGRAVRRRSRSSGGPRVLLLRRRGGRPVTDLASATAAIRLISEQGEGLGGAIYDHEGELAHYYRFRQLAIGKYFQEGDRPDEPTDRPCRRTGKPSTRSSATPGWRTTPRAPSCARPPRTSTGSTPSS